MTETSTTEPPTPPRTSGVRHEPSDVNVRAIALTGAIMIVFAIIVHLVVWGVFDLLEGRENKRTKGTVPLAVQEGRRPLDQRVQEIRKPRLEGLKRLATAGERRPTKAETSRLDSYGWVDKERGIAHIPIDVAMDAIAAGKLLPATAKPAPASGTQTTPSDANSARGTPRSQP